MGHRRDGVFLAEKTFAFVSEENASRSNLFSSNLSNGGQRDSVRSSRDVSSCQRTSAVLCKQICGVLKVTRYELGQVFRNQDRKIYGPKSFTKRQVSSNLSQHKTVAIFSS